MRRSRRASFAIMAVAAVAAVAAGTLLLEHTGFLAGAFRTEILARVDDGDVVNAADLAGGTMR